MKKWLRPFLLGAVLGMFADMALVEWTAERWYLITSSPSIDVNEALIDEVEAENQVPDRNWFNANKPHEIEV